MGDGTPPDGDLSKLRPAVSASTAAGADNSAGFVPSPANAIALPGSSTNARHQHRISAVGLSRASVAKTGLDGLPGAVWQGGVCD